MAKTRWRRESERRYSEAARNFKLLVAAMHEFRRTLPPKEPAAREKIGKSIMAAHPRWIQENAPSAACKGSIAWLGQLSLVAAVANVETYLDEMEHRIKLVRKTTSHACHLSAVAKRAFILYLAPNSLHWPTKPDPSEFPAEFIVLELLVRIRNRFAHSDGTAASSLTEYLDNSEVADAWNSLGTKITKRATSVPAFPSRDISGVPIVEADLAVYAGIVAKECIMRIDEQFCTGLSEREILHVAVAELVRRSKIEKPQHAKNFESWVRGTLTIDFGLSRFKEPSMCRTGELARELRRVGIWNSIPGSSKKDKRQALQAGHRLATK